MEIETRKREHIDICLSRDVQAHYNYWNDVSLVHKTLPNLNKRDLDVTATLLGKKLDAPIVIAAMTGGYDGGETINKNLAAAAEYLGIAMGVGSQRAGLEHPELAYSYSVVTENDIPLTIGNLGLVQFIPQKNTKLYGVSEARAAIKMIDADALAIHLNIGQEIVQHGEVDNKNWQTAMKELTTQLKTPIIMKETGCGIYSDDALEFKEIGVAAIDSGGLGGTSFPAIEYYRAKARKDLVHEHFGSVFWDWGIPSPASTLEANVGLELISGGGIRTGMDIAKAIALGADACSIAYPLLKPATESADAVIETLEIFIKELKATMLLTGCSSLSELRKAPLMITGFTREWLKTNGRNIPNNRYRANRTD